MKMEAERSPKRVRVEDDAEDPVLEETKETQDDHCSSKRRSIRTQYREIEVRINEGKDEIANLDSEKFMLIMNEVENMHQYVNKPREQVADAEAFLGLTSTLVASVKTHIRGGITPAQFVSCLIREFGMHQGLSKHSPVVNWKNIGSFASPVFMDVPGCSTMIGPMSTGITQRKPVVARRQSRARKGPMRINARPREIEKHVEVVSDTDKSIRIMFEILKEKKAKVENLVLNRNSFAQTIENLFALSFLVKDGRVRIYIDESGSQVVVPCNGPSAQDIKSGAAKTHQFVFRCDVDDWKLMKDIVLKGEELMPARNEQVNVASFKRSEPECQLEEVPEAIPIPIGSKLFNPPPVKKFSRNYGVTIAMF